MSWSFDIAAKNEVDRDLPAIRRYLLENAGRWLDLQGGNGLRIELTRARNRAACSVYHFKLERLGTRLGVVVKRRVPRGSRRHFAGQRMRGRDVWRLNPEPDVQDKATLEPAALSAIERHFGALGDPRFGVVRVLDSAPELQTFVMEAVGEPLLASLFLRQALLRGSARGAPLAAVFANAGAWLREFHTLPPPSTTVTLRPDVEALVASIERAGVYLADSYGKDAFFTRAAAAATAAARDSLPAELPLVVSHGDYAPWNVFVGPGGRVTVFDTFATWRVPRLEDVAFFLFCLRTPWPRVYSQGLAVNAAEISRPSEEFLRGYFLDEEIPWRQIRVFEVQCVLSRWASRVHGVSASRGLIRLGKQVRLALLGRSLRLYLQDLVTELEGKS